MPDQCIPSQVGHLCICSSWFAFSFWLRFGYFERIGPPLFLSIGAPVVSLPHVMQMEHVIYPADKDKAYLLHLFGKLIVRSK